MKISEMNSVQLADTLYRIAEPVAAILSEPDVEKVLENLSKSEASPFAYVGKMVKIVLPIALKKQQKATFGIIAALTGKTVKQIQEQNGLQTIKDAMSCIDADLITFFASSDATAQEKPSA